MILDKLLSSDQSFYVLAIVIVAAGISVFSFRKIGKRPHAHPTAKQIIEKYGDGKYLTGQVAVITGANTGIGLETAKALASAGCRVIICSRSVDNGIKGVVTEIKQPGHGGYVVEDTRNIVVKPIDLADLKSVKAFAEDFLATESRLDFLILNAGVMAIPKKTLTSAGFESQIGVNHFGHAYLTELLRPKLVSQDFPSRVIVLSSSAQSFGTINVKDLHYEKGMYNPWLAYGQSKLANVLYAKSLADDLKGTKVTAISVYPGIIHTGLWKENKIVSFVTGAFFTDHSIPEGAATTVWACVSPQAGSDALRGAYLYECGVAQPSSLTLESFQQKDKKTRDALWKATKDQLEVAKKKLGL